MMMIGTANHYLDLKRKYPQFRNPPPRDWSLKEYGCFFIYDQIKRNGARRVLEFGPGFSTFFATALKPHGVEYWACDRNDSDLGIRANAEKWAAVQETYRKCGATSVNALLGENSDQLPDAHFDLVFSISVIEHIHDDMMRDTVREMKRVLKPGGVSAQTIDVYAGSTKADVWHKAMMAEGFDVPGPYQAQWHWKGPNTTFLEAPRTRYVNFNLLRYADPEKEGPPFNSHFATTLHVAKRP